MSRWTSAGALVAALLVHAVPEGTVLPRTEAETGNGAKVMLPDALAGSVSILVVGFSKGSATASKWWEARLAAEVAGPRKLRVLQVAQLESIPGLLRGFVVGKIKDGVPKEKRDAFLLLFHQREAWKKAAGFEAPDDAYLLATDSSGRVIWRAHAGADDVAYLGLRKQLELLLDAQTAKTEVADPR